jgi:hypothetical protein
VRSIKPTDKPASVRFDKQTSIALRQYSAVVHRSITEIVETALLCYWVAQNDKEAAQAVCTASRIEDEPTAAYPVKDSDPKVQR